ncbi:hypothetical protein K439DRAFT_1656884 [Ramaria rubella]|nr:hypothetical protein K439DRAFT_1656884 [Ramaria rubella]
MPTSTATMTVPAATKVSKLPVTTGKSPSIKSAVATLRSLYPRAARAFLQRDVVLTHTLLTSAFTILQPPISPSPDFLVSHRRKWDILRITLETTLYSSGQSTDPLPESLQLLVQLSPPSLVATMHARSLQLFTPANRGKPNAEFLPSQILVALSLASVKIECVQVGREIIEDWLSRRNQASYDSYKEAKLAKDDAEGYEKVLETYCLNVLPILEDWDYAREFLRYENELPQDKRMYLIQSLQILHAQHLTSIEEARERQRNLTASPSSSRSPTPRPLPVRAPSPTPSVSSTSTTSTHTAVPLTPRPHPVPSSLTPVTLIPRARTPAQSHSSLTTIAAPRRTASVSPLPIPPSAPQMPVSAIPPPSLLTLLKTSLLPHLTRSKFTFLLLMFLIPLASFVFRMRRRRLRLLASGGSAALVVKPRGNAADEARRRLKAGLWGEIRKAVVDTVKMAGGGLV